MTSKQCKFLLKNLYFNKIKMYSFPCCKRSRNDFPIPCFQKSGTKVNDRILFSEYEDST